MKTLASAALGSLLLLSGCSSPQSESEGGADGAALDARFDGNPTEDAAQSMDSASMDDGASSPDSASGPDGAMDGASAIDSSAPACPPPVAMTANSTVPGAITTPNPTIRNVAIEWAITGDANNNGVVRVRYRRRGEPSFRDAMPLRRIPAGTTAGASWSNRHSGSIFDLEPNTEYEIELSLLDPDGGCEVRTSTVRTRAVPVVPSDARVRMVTPATFAGALSSAMPGDVLEMAAGNYAAFTIERDGATDRPITLRGAAGAIVMGNIDLFTRHDVRIEGLTIRGRVRFNGSRNIAIVRNTVETTGDGIVALSRSEDCYIADNTVTGATRWQVGSLGVSGTNVGEGILVYGPGHVIEHNRVTGFRDAISLTEDPAAEQWSIDIVENEIDTGADDGIEADFCAHNCRVVRNRLTNVFMGISSQPSLGGPTYFVRNAMYNVVYSAFKLQRTSYGDVLLHNSVVKSGDAFGIYTGESIHRAYARNNVFVGGPGGTYNGYDSGTGRVINIATAEPTCDFDYDGFGSSMGMFEGRYGALRFSSLAELRAMSTEAHAVALGLDVFATSVAYPSAPFPERMRADLRLRAGAAAVDRGAVLPNINDGHAGAAPDLGAYEQGAALPAYGPR